jgi:SpoVK/Ycf46/Vps4 family AAA+-type ATPase
LSNIPHNLENLHSIYFSDIILKNPATYKANWEKQLDILFDKAQKNNWILFVDEADALFGKRTTVRDLHDHYSNQEINYLIQRIEAYKGKVIIGMTE